MRGSLKLVFIYLVSIAGCLVSEWKGGVDSNPASSTL